MAEIRYPPEPEPGETRVEWERRALNPWRQREKARLMVERRIILCERCGMKPPMDLDEGIIPRCDMGGFSLNQRRLAFGSVNLFLLCMDCNRNQAHDRSKAWNLSVQRYGHATMVDWYYSLELKLPPRKDWIDGPDNS